MPSGAAGTVHEPRSVLLVTVGSRGDVQPMLVLAEELCRRGHRVRMAAPPNFEQMVTRAGLGFLPIGTDTAVFLERHGALVEKNPLVALPRQVALIRAEAERQIRDLLATTERAELVVGAGLAFGASTLADRDGVRYVYLSFTLSGIRSREYPPAPLPVFGLPRWANAALWAGIVGLFDRALADTITRQRRAHGLGPVPAWHSIHGSHTLLAQDTILGALPADAVGCIGQVPALTSLAPLVPLSPEVEEFLGDDAAPARPRRVYLGFGSMPSADQGRLFALSSEVGRRTRARIVLFSAYGERRAERLDEHVFRIAENDHRALFPRMDLVVHHGGAGTSATSLRAGAPQLVVPHIQDQFAHGRRVHELGLGPKPVPKAKLTAEVVAAALEASAQYRERAQAVAQALAGQSGAGQAAELLEQAASAEHAQ